MAVKGIGIDVAEIKRFLPFKKEKNHRFLTNNFTVQELDYCFLHSDALPHLAGTFAAKEAVWKAAGRPKLLQSEIEVRREKSGHPIIFIRGRRQKNILISISHAAGVAIAVAIKQ